MAHGSRLMAVCRCVREGIHARAEVSRSRGGLTGAAALSRAIGRIAVVGQWTKVSSGQWLVDNGSWLLALATRHQPLATSTAIFGSSSSSIARWSPAFWRPLASVGGGWEWWPVISGQWLVTSE